jgi:hypothetical protein
MESVKILRTNKVAKLTKDFCYEVALEQAQRAEAAEARSAKLQAERDQAIKAGQELQVAIYDRKGLGVLTHREEYAILTLNRLQGKS